MSPLLNLLMQTSKFVPTIKKTSAFSPLFVSSQINPSMQHFTPPYKQVICEDTNYGSIKQFIPNRAIVTIKTTSTLL